ncbi:MAG: 3-deoxy-D-manno-octulosonic acid transferase [Candidatus Omnitrophota bacterium]
MFIVYDLIFLILTIFNLPLYLLRGKFHNGFSRRLGFLPDNLNLERPIWVHAVSVGEAVAIKGLVAGLRETYPQKKIVISTVTSTGNKIANTLAKEGDFLTYLPLDFSFIVGGVLKRIKPCMFIIAETEIWPNLISCLYRQNIPIITVNGRISDGSYKGYRAIKFFIRPILRKVTQFCVQTDTDFMRLRDLGVDKDRVLVTGNVKFDINPENVLPEFALSYRQKLWLTAEDKLLVCGSTHPKEEEIIFEAYKKLLVVLPKLKLLIAPRHPERSRDIGNLASRCGFMPIFISSVPKACPTCVNRPVFILDVIGELFNYYSAADIVFIGGSLVKKGGHNILEPASIKKPVIFGPHMFNFRQISKLFLRNNAAIMVYNSKGLTGKIKEILKSDAMAKELVDRAYDLIKKNRGATQKNIQAISKTNLN